MLRLVLGQLLQQERLTQPLPHHLLIHLHLLCLKLSHAAQGFPQASPADDFSFKRERSQLCPSCKSKAEIQLMSLESSTSGYRKLLSLSQHKVCLSSATLAPCCSNCQGRTSAMDSHGPFSESPSDRFALHRSYFTFATFCA